jgi:tetratricopeptide (TPR) repeat protein
MTRLIAVLAIPLSLSALWQRLTRETNSHAANVGGVKAYSARQYPKAVDGFASAMAADPSSPNAFNLGTAQIAAGKTEDGSATLGKAMADRSLRGDALYNRGNSALASSAFDAAIRDYGEALRLAPGDAQAKRNLEIALARKRAQQQAQSGQQKNPSGSQPNPQRPQPSPGGKNDQQHRGEQSADSILRAVQEQEQEELNRMKRARAERGRVGW